MNGALYNDNDRFVAGWLRRLQDAGHLTAGTVDERSIVDVQASDLLGYRWVHLFAGIGGWDYALRLAGWRDPAWTVSCPCPPFSSAGRKKRCPACGGARPVPCPRRTGHFICVECEHAWYADARHLWPEAWRLIRDCHPPVIFGEQVASTYGQIWLAGVRATLERLGYAFGWADLAAAGIGAPHIRQRLFWVAESRSERVRADRRGTDAGTASGDQGAGDQWERLRADAGNGFSPCGLADAGQQPPRNALAGSGPGAGSGPSERRAEALGEPGRHRDPRGMGDSASIGFGQRGIKERAGIESAQRREPIGSSVDGRLLRTWEDFDVIPCRDGKARRVERGSFPLAHGIPGRVGRLRGYGNAIVPEVAAEFVMAYMEARIAS